MTLFRMTPAEVDALVGANLRRLREEACLEMPHAAVRLGIDPDGLAAAEAGAAHLTCSELDDATRCVDCCLDVLFDAPPPPRIPS